MNRLADYLLQLYPIEHVPLKRRIAFHILFWGCMYIIFWFQVGFPSDTIIYRFVLASSLVITNSVFFYTFIYLTPYIFEKYDGFILLSLLCILIITFYFFLALESYERVSFIIEKHWLSAKNNRMYGANYSFYKAGFWSYFSPNIIISDTFGVIIYSLPAIFLKFSRIFAKNLSEKKQLEIDFLRLQVNPHFLVNTLNNIYSLVVTEDQRSSNAILSLSNLLNYVLYESSLPIVTLEKEVSFLQDFIALEKIRSSTKIQVNVKIEGELIGNIAPLILIAFIENAFKHSGSDSTIQSYINIYIKVEQDILLLSVVNSKARKASEKMKKTLGGIGLINVRKRLTSLYPNRHSLQVFSESTQHQVLLKIQLTQK